MIRDRKLVIISIGLLILILGCSQNERMATSVLIANAVETPAGDPSPTPTIINPNPTAASNAYYPEDSMVRVDDEMVMVYVPAGTFQMGSSVDQIESAISMCEQYPNQWKKCERDWFEVEAPQFSVTIDGFWIDSTEVTNSHYELCVEAGRCQPSRLANNPTYNGADYPVAGVPWQDAADYCDWVGGRLSTEVEWEYAARGSQALAFPWGDEFRCEGGNLYDPDTGCDDGFSEPAPVGSFPAGVSWCGRMI